MTGDAVIFSFKGQIFTDVQERNVLLAYDWVAFEDLAFGVPLLQGMRLRPAVCLNIRMLVSFQRRHRVYLLRSFVRAHSRKDMDRSRHGISSLPP